MPLKKKDCRGGFTLVEVLVVVVIVVTITMFAVPSYKKSQARAQYMSASGVLVELATATQMLMEEYPDLEISSAAFSSNTPDYSSAPTASTAAAWMLGKQYLGKVDFQSDGKYKGYNYAFSTTGKPVCSSTCKRDAAADALACMENKDHTIDAYKCAWVSREDGMLHNSNG
ncbi:MAG: prepilin-type N-terminal cleavage/methylation domain-containing protein [Elusimicrobiaceae bacterium]|nr:prepilin-type N-terminal cleavage/methylation domain-containing protein [Elusimicrobiaceae bacterium]